MRAPFLGITFRRQRRRRLLGASPRRLKPVASRRPARHPPNISPPEGGERTPFHTPRPLFGNVSRGLRSRCRLRGTEPYRAGSYRTTLSLIHIYRSGRRDCSCRHREITHTGHDSVSYTHLHRQRQLASRTPAGRAEDQQRHHCRCRLHARSQPE